MGKSGSSLSSFKQIWIREKMENISQFVSEDRDSNALDNISAKYSQILCVFHLKKKDKKMLLEVVQVLFLCCYYLRGLLLSLVLFLN